MARCCGTAGSCICKVVGAGNVQVTGTGQAQDPFVITGFDALEGIDNDQFAIVIVGDGTAENPHQATVTYATTATLDGLPDVAASAPTNGQVLGWDASAGQWVAQAATTASAGSVLTGEGIEGDGSGGNPLDVTPNPGGWLTVRALGVDLTDDAINRLVRFFPDSAARDAATPDPVPGSVSMLETELGRLDYWTGVQWLPLDNGVRLQITGSEMMTLSGFYTGGSVFHYVAQVSDVTDENGDVEIIPATDLVNNAGVLSVQAQEVGLVGFKATVYADEVEGKVMARCFRLDDGTPYVGMSVDLSVSATLY